MKWQQVGCGETNYWNLAVEFSVMPQATWLFPQSTHGYRGALGPQVTPPATYRVMGGLRRGNASRLPLSSQGVPKIPRNVTDEAMHRHLRNAMADDRVHRPSHSTQWRFVSPREIQLGFGRGQRVYRKLALHQR